MIPEQTGGRVHALTLAHVTLVERADPTRYKTFVAEAQAEAQRRYAVYQQLAGITVPVVEPSAETAPSPAAGGKEA